MKLCVIGLGQMGTTIIQGIRAENIFAGEDIVGCDPRAEEIDSQKLGEISIIEDNRVGVKKADIILIAVKPQILMKVLDEIKDLLEDKLLISIAAGVKIDRISTSLPSSVRKVRVMPNTPALIKSGVSALSFGDNCNEEDHRLVQKIFRGIGETVEIEEKLMDAVTGLSGSGPAYVYTIIEALSDGGVLKGLPRKQARRLAAATVLGAARMVLETDKHPAQLKDMVTSPAGTTIAGLEELEKGALRSTLISAVSRAADRSAELGE